MNLELLNKYEKLKEYFCGLGSVAVAFSGGVDSTFMLYAAKEALGDKAIAVTASLLSFPKRELDEAKRYCEKLNVRHFVVLSDEFQIDGFSDNPPNRCYLCKKELFKKIIKVSEEQEMAAVVEGSNLDDNGDYRPGLVAIAELGIKSPLREIGFTKKEIRVLSEYFDIPTWNKPSLACLATRFPYGNKITKEKLIMVDKAEQLMFDLGFKQVRVRIHDDIARIELIPTEFSTILEESTRELIYSKFKEYGFNYVALDLIGYRTGSMNEILR